MSFFQRRRARGKMFPGYLDFVCLSSGRIKANWLLHSDCAPPLGGREKKNAVPSQQPDPARPPPPSWPALFMGTSQISVASLPHLIITDNNNAKYVGRLL